MTKTKVFLLFIFLSAFVHAQGLSNISHPVDKTTPGAAQQIIMKLHFEEASLAAHYITQFTFNTNGTTNTSDILNAKLYTTGDLNTFENPVQYGSTVNNPNGVFIFSGNEMLLWGSSFYWLVFDISPAAQVNNFIDAECTLILITMMPPLTPFPASPPGNLKIVTPLNGTFTVGAGGDFLNLHQAVDSLSNSYIGNEVSLEMLGSYSSAAEIFPVNIPLFAGASAANPVIIKPHSSADTIVISSTSGQTIIFDGASHVIIEGGTGNSKKIKIVNNNYHPAVILRNNASYNSFKNCIIMSKSNLTGSFEFAGSSSYWNTISGCLFENLNEFELPHSAIYSRVDDGFVVKGIEVRDCTIKNFGSTGVYLGKNTDGAVIEDCKIFEDTTFLILFGAPVTGIIIDTAKGDFLIRNNIIHSIYSSVLAVYTARGIMIGYNQYVENIFIYNNFFSLGHFSYVEANFYGIEAFGGPETEINIKNNSFWLGGSSAFPVLSSCIRKTGPAQEFNLFNNLFINTRTVSTGGWQYAVNVLNTSGFQSDYNNLYSNSSSGNNVIGFWQGNTTVTFQDWKNISGQDPHSVSKPVSFLSKYDLHIAGSSLGDTELAGIFLPETPFDIDGEPRPLQFPYMGADENLSYPLPVELVSFSAEVEGESILLKWSTASEINNTGFEIERKQNNDPWNIITFIPGNGTTTSTSFYSYKDNNLNEGKYSYRLKQVDMDGTFNYSNEITVNFLRIFSYKLEQNYPNPFNPSTIITYEIPVKDLVQLKIFDLLGNEIETLVNSQQEPGRYNVVFNAKGLSSGVYFYEIRTGDFYLNKKMLYIK